MSLLKKKRTAKNTDQKKETLLRTKRKMRRNVRFGLEKD